MTNPLAESSPTARGRLLAALYLFLVAAGIIAQTGIADRLVVSGDPAATAANIVADPARWRLAFSIFMLEMVAQVGVCALFYDLLKPVNRSVARGALLVGLTGTVIKTMSRLFFYTPLLLLGGAPWLSAFTPAQLQAMAYAFIRINNQGAGIALIFFGFESLLEGWLIYRSGFLPRFLGVLAMAGGLGWLTWVWPPLGSRTFVAVALLAIVGVILTSGWLLFPGVDDAKWRERAALAAGSIWR